MNPAYCPYYCEENIWQLCGDPQVSAPQRKVLVICNDAHKVAIWGQRIADDPTLPITWDYHVVLLTRAPRQAWEVWDLDGDGPCPRSFASWIEHSFHSIGLLPPMYAPRFRMLECADYRRHFRSDRRHMRDPNGSTIQPEPSWPAILGEPVPGYPDEGSNLAFFLDTRDRGFLGRVFDLQELRAWQCEHDLGARA